MLSFWCLEEYLFFSLKCHWDSIWAKEELQAGAWFPSAQVSTCDKIYISFPEYFILVKSLVRPKSLEIVRRRGDYFACTCVINLNVFFSGIGYASMVIVAFLNIYYIVILAWALFYLFQSFTTGDLPWTNCDESWPCCVTNHSFINDSNYDAEYCNGTTTTPETDYWEYVFVIKLKCSGRLVHRCTILLAVVKTTLYDQPIKGHYALLAKHFKNPSNVILITVAHILRHLVVCVVFPKSSTQQLLLQRVSSQ